MTFLQQFDYEFMKGIIQFILVVIVISIFSCAPDEKRYDENSLTLVAFGPADSLNVKNKGFSARVYCFIDFNNDSVLIRENRIYDSVSVTKTGHLKEIKNNGHVKRVMKILDSLKNGSMVGKEHKLNEEYPELYCGWDIFVEYKEYKMDKWFYTSAYTVQSLNEVIQFLLEESMLKESKSVKIEDDDLMVAIVSREGFVLNPPPPVRTIIKFLPPKVE